MTQRIDRIHGITEDSARRVLWCRRADRFERFVDIVGEPGRVIGAPDCGFGTLAGLHTVDSEIAWAKLESLVEGARLATARVEPSTSGSIPVE